MDMQPTRMVLRVEYTIVLTWFEIVTVMMLYCYTVLVDKQLVMFQRFVVQSLLAFKCFTASCMCMLMLWFFCELVFIGYFFWKGVGYCLMVILNSYELNTSEIFNSSVCLSCNLMI